jgi:hypothetical protein
MEQKENEIPRSGYMRNMESLDVVLAREEEVAREWQWLHDALNEVARVRAERGDAAAFRLMQQQAMVVGQRRIELRMQAAELEARRH